MTEPAPPADARLRPPLLVWVACGLSLLFAVFSGLFAVLTWLQIQSTGLRTALGWGVLGLYVLTSVLYAAVAIFLLRRASWAWVTGIVLGGVNVALGLIVPLIVGAVPNCFTLVPQILILVILFRPEVVAWCRPSRDR